MARKLCERYGPGRLPYASRRDVGGGIAMAATGLLATVLWFGGSWLLVATETVNGSLGFFLVAGLVFLPFSIPTSFIVGMLLWRHAYAEENRQFRGALFGAITSIVSLLAGAIGLAMVLAASNVYRGEMVLTEATVFMILLVPTGFFMAIVAAGWLVLPLSVFGGWYHERAKRSGDHSASQAPTG